MDRDEMRRLFVNRKVERPAVKLRPDPERPDLDHLISGLTGVVPIAVKEARETLHRSAVCAVVTISERRSSYSAIRANLAAEAVVKFFTSPEVVSPFKVDKIDEAVKFLDSVRKGSWTFRLDAVTPRRLKAFAVEMENLGFNVDIGKADAGDVEVGFRSEHQAVTVDVDDEGLDDDVRAITSKYMGPAGDIIGTIELGRLGSRQPYDYSNSTRAAASSEFGLFIKRAARVDTPKGSPIEPRRIIDAAIDDNVTLLVRFEAKPQHVRELVSSLRSCGLKADLLAPDGEPLDSHGLPPVHPNARSHIELKTLDMINLGGGDVCTREELERAAEHFRKAHPEADADLAARLKAFDKTPKRVTIDEESDDEP
jgi:hypothetical protein